MCRCIGSERVEVDAAVAGTTASTHFLCFLESLIITTMHFAAAPVTLPHPADDLGAAFRIVVDDAVAGVVGVEEGNEPVVGEVGVETVAVIAGQLRGHSSRHDEEGMWSS